MDQMPYDLTIFSVATNRYIAFWIRMVNSYLDTNDSTIRVQWIVFTDRENEIHPELISRLGNSLLIINTPHQEWPFPTLLRYKYLLGISERVLGRVVMHLDADMLFVSDLNFHALEKLSGTKGVNLVRHPGYYRPTGLKKMLFYLKYFEYLARDIKTKVKYGSLGTWELNKQSLAYVPRSSRQNYVCGGVWLGKNLEILDLCKILSSRIDADLDQGIIAVFHDESHLNWYQSQKNFNLLSPELCFDLSYRQLNALTPTILAVNKNAETVWVR